MKIELTIMLSPEYLDANIEKHILEKTIQKYKHTTLKDIGYISKNNKYDLAKKILKLINSSILSKESSLKAIKRANLFSWKEYIDLHRNIYDNLS